MSRKTLVCLFVLGALAAQSACAAPSMSVAPLGIFGGNREWLVSVQPDAALFSNNPPNGVGGSLAVELAFSIDDPTDLLSVAIADPSSWPAANPGNNPFTGGVTFGTYIDLINDRTFAAYGSTYFTTGTPKPFLKITTAGAGLTTLRYGSAASGQSVNGALIAQGGQNFTGYTGVVSVPEPTTALLVVLSALGCISLRRRR